MEGARTFARSADVTLVAPSAAVQLKLQSLQLVYCCIFRPRLESVRGVVSGTTVRALVLDHKN